MRITKPKTENERLLASVLLVFILYFGLDSMASLLLPEDGLKAMRYRMTLNFILSIIAGVSFYIWAKPVNVNSTGNNNYKILEKALNEDEAIVIDIIRNNEGVTQDSLRFRTGFSKSKVSAIMLNLEKKEIITRERLGRTYKIFISDWIKK
ncbi:MAG TPA: hypothetical protein ENH28_05190 [Euryarchaeota archaeon]|nr:hypothetical protein BMS3Bbin15_01405 [archaeon BMS3Bbin15]HDL15525.1 hypothetical protein [Euryarchaeota archaeon]